VDARPNGPGRVAHDLGGDGGEDVGRGQRRGPNCSSWHAHSRDKKPLEASLLKVRASPQNLRTCRSEIPCGSAVSHIGPLLILIGY
jgi:hypothetical protein